MQAYIHTQPRKDVQAYIHTQSRKDGIGTMLGRGWVVSIGLNRSALYLLGPPHVAESSSSLLLCNNLVLPMQGPENPRLHLGQALRGLLHPLCIWHCYKPRWWMNQGENKGDHAHHTQHSSKAAISYKHIAAWSATKGFFVPHLCTTLTEPTRCRCTRRNRFALPAHI